MKYLALAFIVCTILVCDLVSDVVIPGTKHDRNWDVMGTVAVLMAVAAFIAWEKDKK